MPHALRSWIDLRATYKVSETVFIERLGLVFGVEKNHEVKPRPHSQGSPMLVTSMIILAPCSFFMFQFSVLCCVRAPFTAVTNNMRPTAFKRVG